MRSSIQISLLPPALSPAADIEGRTAEIEDVAAMRMTCHHLLLVGVPLVAAFLASPPAVADPEGAQIRHQASRSCVDVEIAGERTPDYDCLTDALRRTIDATKPIANLPPIARGGNPNALGMVTPTEARQQYGPNFGKSVVPYRPHKTYPVPLLGGRQ